jgi:hypothetical protein
MNYAIHFHERNVNRTEMRLKRRQSLTSTSPCPRTVRRPDFRASLLPPLRYAPYSMRTSLTQLLFGQQFLASLLQIFSLHRRPVH